MAKLILNKKDFRRGFYLTCAFAMGAMIGYTAMPPAPPAHPTSEVIEGKDPGSKSLAESWNSWADTVSSIAQVIALFAGGYWFFIRRLHYPRGEVTLTVEEIALGHGKVNIHAVFTFKNIGEVRANLPATLVRFQQVLPITPYWMSTELEEAHGIKDASKKLGKEITMGEALEMVDLKSKLNFPWPWIMDKQNELSGVTNENVIVEPGEYHYVYADAIVDDTTEVVRIYAHAKNVRASKDVGWSCEKIFYLRKGEANDRPEQERAEEGGETGQTNRGSSQTEAGEEHR